MTDMIDLATVKVFNSPDIHAWPATTAITKLSLQPTGVHVEFTKQDGPDRWPDVPFGDEKDHGTLQFTLWIVLNIFGQWCAAGCIEFWYGLYESGGPVDGYAKNWYYDPNRWPGMAGHQPAVGEQVGFLITSGDARHGDEAVGLHERSNIVAIAFPDAAGAVFTFAASAPVLVPAPPHPPLPFPAPSPAPAPAPAPPAVDDTDKLLEDLLATGDRIADGLTEWTAATIALSERIDRLEKNGIKVHL